MLTARPQYADQLDFVQIQDFAEESHNLEDAVKEVDGVIHVASVSVYVFFTYISLQSCDNAIGLMSASKVLERECTGSRD